MLVCHLTEAAWWTRKRVGCKIWLSCLHFPLYLSSREVRDVATPTQLKQELKQRQIDNNPEGQREENGKVTAGYKWRPPKIPRVNPEAPEDTCSISHPLKNAVGSCWPEQVKNDEMHSRKVGLQRKRSFCPADIYRLELARTLSCSKRRQSRRLQGLLSFHSCRLVLASCRLC